MGSSRDFASFAEALAPQYSSLLVDLPGHGQSPWSAGEPLSFDVVSRALNGLLEDNRITSYRLFGYSMGGRLALTHVFGSPGRCLAALIESAHPGYPSAVDRERRVTRDHEIAHRLQTEPLGLFLGSWYRNEVFRGLRKDGHLLARLAASRSDNDPSKLAVVLEKLGTGRQPPHWRELAKTDRPIRFLVGSADGKYVGIARRVSALSSRIDHVVIPGAGHAVHLEAPQAYLGAVRSFLTQY